MKIVTSNSATLQYFELLSSQLWLPTIEKTFAAPLILCLWGIDIYKMLWRVSQGAGGYSNSFIDKFGIIKMFTR